MYYRNISWLFILKICATNITREWMSNTPMQDLKSDIWYAPRTIFFFFLLGGGWCSTCTSGFRIENLTLHPFLLVKKLTFELEPIGYTLYYWGVSIKQMNIQCLDYSRWAVKTKFKSVIIWQTFQQDGVL